MKVKFENNFEDAKKVRVRVFMEEQGFKNEFDEIDKRAHHVTIYQEDEVIGCARTFIEGNPKEIHIGRIAILKPYRNQGWGRKLVEACESQYKNADFVLSAQCRIQGFYESMGYEVRGNIYMDEMVPHIEMIKKHKN